MCVCVCVVCVCVCGVCVYVCVLFFLGCRMYIRRISYVADNKGVGC